SKAFLAQRADCNERTIANAEILKSVTDGTATAITDALNDGRKAEHGRKDGAAPFVALPVADLFDYAEASGKFTARTAPTLPDEGRAFIKALLSKAAQKSA